MDLIAAIQDGASNPLLLFGAAVVLGGLHGLEPGHSKTMMAAFIVAVRGTVPQAILLGLSAAISHTVIVWVLALAALTWGDEMIAEEMEPWFILGSGVVILAVAAWILAGTLREARARKKKHHHHHHHGHDRHHHHHHDPHHGHESEDAHARAHAREIEKRFGESGKATTGQILAFGLSGGLLPCAAAVTVLILCLHLQQFWLGVGLVASFSLGLALVLVAVGVAAAWSVNVASRKWKGFDKLLARVPYLSAGVIALIGAAMIYSGLVGLESPHPHPHPQFQPELQFHPEPDTH